MKQAKRYLQFFAKYLLLPTVVLAMVVVLGALATRSVIQSDITKARRITTSNGVETLETVAIGGIEQWIQVRGKDRDNPVILYLHGGPGSTMMPSGHAFQSDWENAFTVVQWDQRGAGKTRNTNGKVGLEVMTLDRMVEDAREVTLYLLQRFGRQRIFILGHSWGSYLGIRLALQYPELYHAYVGTGQMVNIYKNERLSYYGIVALAEERGNQEALAALEELGPPPYTQEQLMVQREWLMKLGGAFYGETNVIPQIKIIATAPEYSLLDIYAFFNGGSSIELVYDSLMAVDLPSRGLDFQIPIFFFLGRHDYVTPSSLAEMYFSEISAPQKEIVWFEKAAHAAMLAEPEKFTQALIEHLLPITSNGN
jgi:pimeloyl-ACP methyl ester carboxylesterase|tara:strand:+ start:1663 stop:2763 length:1101 start_codon:yes stop_codon:yes gene_type:complete